ncbi:MAG: UDP-3-O-(3-hydroxymyristoyl)glucosamine N-acyltransferase [Gemmatimonadota bacterium]|nr:MAG: UDP-3-O-(3-hydroxymyristoyl)glucosamine N-acyltransferase [Gemmatimonadota bacterium]
MNKAAPDHPDTLTLAELAELVSGMVRGDGSVPIRDVAPIHQALSDEIGVLFDRRYLKHLDSTRAGAVLVSSEFSDSVDPKTNCVIVDDARRALRPLLSHLHPSEPTPAGVHPTAVLGRRVVLGEAVCIGPFVVLEDGVIVGDRTHLHAHVVLGRGVSVGNDSVIHPQVVLYPHVVLGDRVVVHAGVRIGVDGFGYSSTPGGIEKIPHVGRCTIGDDVEIGANTCVDRGTIGATRVGPGTKLDNLVQLGHNVEVGPNCLMAAQVGIGGSTLVGAGTTWGGQSGAIDHMVVPEGVVVAGKAAITHDVKPGDVVAGFPARRLQDFRRAMAGLYRLDTLRRKVRNVEKAVADLQVGGS